MLPSIGAWALGVHIQASGASFPSRLYADAFFGARVAGGADTTYTTTSSQRGICRLMDYTTTCDQLDTVAPYAVSWASTDIPLTAAEYQKFSDIQLYPTAIGAVVPSYNLPHVNSSSTELQLTMEVFARILMGEITSWHDPALLNLNPWLLALPPTSIKAVVNYDGSGTTYILKRALASAYPRFGEVVNISGDYYWGPDARAHRVADTNFGMAAALAEMPYSIGYLSLSEALDVGGVRTASIRKESGAVVTASTKSISIATSELGINFGNNGDLPCRLTADLIGAVGAFSWPIVSFTYLAIRTNTDLLGGGDSCHLRREMFNFWAWFFLNDFSRELALSRGFQPLPIDEANLVVDRLATDLRCNGNRVVAVWPLKLRFPFTSVKGLCPISRRLIFAYKALLAQSQAVEIPGGSDLTHQSRSTSAEVAELLLCCALTSENMYNTSRDISALGLVYTDALAELPVATQDQLVMLPTAGTAFGIIFTLCGPVPELQCEESSFSLKLTLDALIAICEGEIDTWDDPRLAELNVWMQSEPIASRLRAVPITLFSTSLETEAMTLFRKLLQRQRPNANITLKALGRAGNAEVRQTAEAVQAAVMATKLSMGFVVLSERLDRRLSLALIRGDQPESLFVPPATAYIEYCTLGAQAREGPFRLATSPHRSCYPLSLGLTLIARKHFEPHECVPMSYSPLVNAAPVGLVLLFSWGFQSNTSSPLLLAVRSAGLGILAGTRAEVQRQLASITCNGTSVLETMETSPVVDYLLFVVTILGILAVVTVFLFLSWRIYATHVTRLLNEIDENDPKKLLLALFSNPRLPSHAFVYGMRPLSFGQDMKHLLRSLDMRDVAIEPAATLEDAQTALITHTPKIVVFSGHTFMGALAFEDVDGKIDEHAEPDTFALLLQGRLPYSSQVDTPNKRMSWRPRRWTISPSSGRASRAHTISCDPESILSASRSMPVKKMAHPKSDRGPASAERMQAQIEKKLGAIHSPENSTDAKDTLKKELLNRLECVVLNGCKTATIGRRLLGLADHISVVCWSTLAEDNAARAFSAGLYQNIQKQRSSMLAAARKRRHSQRRVFKMEEAFKAGCESFVKAGFQFGDPEDHLHPIGHPHIHKPNFTECWGCTPPVHGEVILLHTVNGEARCVLGSSLFPNAETQRGSRIHSRSTSTRAESKVEHIHDDAARRRWKTTGQAMMFVGRARLRRVPSLELRKPANTPIRCAPGSTDSILGFAVSPTAFLETV